MSNMQSKNVVFFIEFVLLMSEAHLNAQSLNCFNDYRTTMYCDFTSDKPLNCSGYSADFVSPDQKHFMCRFLNSKRASNDLFKCECTIKMPVLVNLERYTASLMEEKKILLSKPITALDDIKPIAPEISAVIPTEHGNFNVTWKTNYPERTVFSESLRTQLSYKKKGEADAEATTVDATMTFYEILGSYLEPNSEYVVKARSYSTKYETRFSDWSQEVEWSNPESTERVLTIVIPIFLVLIVINICAFYWCFTRLKAKWWDTIPNPSNNIKYMLPGNPKVFIPKQYDPSSNCVDILTISVAEEKPWVSSPIEESGQDDPYNPVTSSVPTKDSGISSANDSQKCLSHSGHSGSSSDSGYKNILYSRVSVTPFQGVVSQDVLNLCLVQPELRCDSFSDSCHDFSKGELWKACSPLAHLHKNLQALPLFTKAPITLTEFEYRPCDSGTTSTPPAEGASLTCPFQMDIQNTLLPSSSLETCRGDDGYESFSETVSKTTAGQTDFPACTLSPSEEGYQALQSAIQDNTKWPSAADKVNEETPSVEWQDKCGGHDWEPQHWPEWGISNSITYASQYIQKLSQESPPHSALTVSPIIQTFTDSAYHRV